MNALEEGLYDQLAAGAVLVAEVSTRIYRQMAPEQATYPLVIYHYAGGGDENLTPNRSHNLLYGARAVSTTSADHAGDIAELIDAQLHRQIFTVIGWTVILCRKENQIRYPEVDASGKRFWHAGAFYRIRLD